MNVEKHVVSAAFNDALYVSFHSFETFVFNHQIMLEKKITLLTSLRRTLVQDVAHDEKETVLVLTIAQTQLGLDTFVHFNAAIYNLLSQYTHLLA